MAKKLGFFHKIRNRFALSFLAIVVVLTTVVMMLIANDFKNLIDRFARDSLDSMSQSVFETLFVSMNYGDNEVVNKVLKDLKTKNLVDKLEIYRNVKIDELFEYNISQHIPLEAASVFLTKQEQYFEIKTGEINGVRFLKPIIARTECLACHTNMIVGDALGVVDLTLSLDKQLKQSEFFISRIVLSILALVLISGLILHFVSKELVFDPIRKLQEATKRLTMANDLDVKVEISGFNEFGDIAHHFNRFIGKVREMNKALVLEEQKTKDLLLNREEEIASRTQEVRILYKELEHYLETVDKNVITSRTNTKGVITYVSSAFCEISGYTKEELLGKPHNIVRHPDMPKSVFQELWETIKDGRTFRGEIKNLKKDGGYYWVDATISPLFDDQGNTREFVAIRHDITTQKELEDTLDKLTEMTIKSSTDQLTGLANRSKLNEFIDSEFARTKRSDRKFALAILDVDHFKAVNDSYGHLEGDFVLKEIAKILSNKTRKTDLVGRWGGEEFMIILTDTTAKSAKTKLEKIRHWIELHDFGVVPRVTASFGVSEYELGDTEEELILRADTALYRAKNSGRNRIEIEPKEQN